MHADTASLEDFSHKQSALNLLEKPLVFRKDEIDLRPAKLQLLFDVMNLRRCFIEKQQLRLEDQKNKTDSITDVSDDENATLEWNRLDIFASKYEEIKAGLKT